MSSSIRMNPIMIRKSLVLGFMIGLRLGMLIMVVGKEVIFLGEGVLVDEEATAATVAEDLMIEIIIEGVKEEDMATEMTDSAEIGTDLILEEVDKTPITLAETAMMTAAEETDLATAMLETVLIMTTEEGNLEMIETTIENEKTGTQESQITITTTLMLMRLAD